MQMIGPEIHQLFVKFLDGKHKILNFDTPSISVSILKSRIEALTSVPSHLQLLRFSNSRILHDSQTLKLAESRETTEIPETLQLNTDGLHRNQLFCSGSSGFQSWSDREVGKFPVVVHLSLRLRGGRRGFGPLLRGAAKKAGQKKTNNFDACRDMSGRRLRNVNPEKKLGELRAAEDERKLERIAGEYIKKKTKEVLESAKSKGVDSAEKYVAKYREESSTCVEVVERSVRESMVNGLKRKGGRKETENHAKRLKIWLGKRKMEDSDSVDMDEEDIDGDKRVEDAKSVITDNGNLSDSSKEAEETPCSITCEKVISGSLDEGSPGYQEEVVSAKESPKSDNSIDGCVDDGKGISRNKAAVEILEEIMDHANMEVPHKFDSSKLKEMVGQLPGVSIPEEIVTSTAEVSSITSSELLEEVSVSLGAEAQDCDKPLNFDEYNSAAELEVPGMERLKAELQTRGLKCCNLNNFYSNIFNMCCRNFCCGISIFTAISLLFLFSALGFFFLWIGPRLPEIHLKSIDFKKFNVTTTPDGLTLDAQSIVSVEVKNPNSNLRMEYDRTRIYVNAVNGDTDLGQVTVPGFTQDKNNVTTLKFTTRAEKEILESKIAEELSNGFKNRKLVMNVEGESGIGIKISSGWAIGVGSILFIWAYM
ncbi:uncharacterized protein [Primulina huaijiensis]|uniref:uncharacterized protein n=1 Tax=Primulina huaijiensis TaxID=1492673 RepID=UPI003CC704C1